MLVRMAQEGKLVPLVRHHLGQLEPQQIPIERQGLLHVVDKDPQRAMLRHLERPTQHHPADIEACLATKFLALEAVFHADPARLCGFPLIEVRDLRQRKVTIETPVVVAVGLAPAIDADLLHPVIELAGLAFRRCEIAVPVAARHVPAAPVHLDALIDEEGVSLDHLAQRPNLPGKMRQGEFRP